MSVSAGWSDFVQSRDIQTRVKRKETISFLSATLFCGAASSVCGFFPSCVLSRGNPKSENRLQKQKVERSAFSYMLEVFPQLFLSGACLGLEIGGWPWGRLRGGKSFGHASFWLAYRSLSLSSSRCGNLQKELCSCACFLSLLHPFLAAI